MDTAKSDVLDNAEGRSTFGKRASLDSIDLLSIPPPLYTPNASGSSDICVELSAKAAAVKSDLLSGIEDKRVDVIPDRSKVCYIAPVVIFPGWPELPARPLKRRFSRLLLLAPLLLVAVALGLWIVFGAVVYHRQFAVPRPDSCFGTSNDATSPGDCSGTSITHTDVIPVTTDAAVHGILTSDATYLVSHITLAASSESSTITFVTSKGSLVPLTTTVPIPVSAESSEQGLNTTGQTTSARDLSITAGLSPTGATQSSGTESSVTLLTSRSSGIAILVAQNITVNSSMAIGQSLSNAFVPATSTRSVSEQVINRTTFFIAPTPGSEASFATGQPAVSSTDGTVQSLETLATSGGVVIIITSSESTSTASSSTPTESPSSVSDSSSTSDIALSTTGSDTSSASTSTSSASLTSSNTADGSDSTSSTATDPSPSSNPEPTPSSETSRLTTLTTSSSTSTTNLAEASPTCDAQAAEGRGTFICANGTTYTSTYDNTSKFHEECNVDYPRDYWAYNNQSRLVKNVYYTNVCSFEACMEECAKYNQLNPTETKCMAVNYSVWLKNNTELFKGNCWLKDVRGWPYSGAFPEDYEHMGSAYLDG